MTVTVQLWYLVPAALTLVAFVLFYISSKRSGMLGGIIEGMFGFGCLIAAIACVLTKWLS